MDMLRPEFRRRRKVSSVGHNQITRRKLIISGIMANVIGGALKRTTGLTGMAVSKNPHHALTVLYSKILRALNKLPQEAAYRKYTEDIINEKFQLVKTTPDIAKLEERIGCGQIEEVIIQAENELALARKMQEWKPWEPLIKEPHPDQWKWPI